MTLHPVSSARRRLAGAARVVSVAALLAAVVAASGCLGPKRLRPVEVDLPPSDRVAGDTVTLRVALGEGLEKQRLTCTGPYRLASDARYVTSYEAGDEISVWGMDGRLMYGRGLSGGVASELWIEPEDPDDRVVWDDRTWRGQVRVLADPDEDTITLINVVPMDDYLAGVVPLEIGAGHGEDEMAALQAQAVVARTYAVTSLGDHADRGFDLYGDVRDQVYGGADAEDPRCTAAGGPPPGRGGGPAEGTCAPTFFPANCGGRTAAREAVWAAAPHPLLPGVPDRRPDGRPWCADGAGATWSRQWTWAGLEGVLQRTLPAYLDAMAAASRADWAGTVFSPSSAGAAGAAPGPLHDLEIAGRTADGRVDLLRVVTGEGVYLVRGDWTRRVLRGEGDDALLRSAWFDLDVDAGRGVAAHGRGYGHGLGLCQEGALARSRAGQDMEGILAAYYPGCRLAPLTDVVLP